MGKGQVMMITSVILTDLSCNEIESYCDHTAVWYNTVIVGKIQWPYVSQSYDSTDVDDHMY